LLKVDRIANVMDSKMQNHIKGQNNKLKTNVCLSFFFTQNSKNFVAMNSNFDYSGVFLNTSKYLYNPVALILIQASLVFSD
jgi:hypothetical protein